MEIRRLGHTGLRVSELCLGCMTFGSEADEKASERIVETFLDAGGFFFDTANAYAGGRSEEILGRVLGARRDAVVIATKFFFPTGPGANDGGASRRHVLQAVEDSLRRLRTDWIDLYQVHLFDAETPLEETLSTLDGLVRQGKVRYVGASNFAAWQLARALGVADLHGWERYASYQPEYSLAQRQIEREHLPLCRAEGLGVLPWGPLSGGLLTGKYRGGEIPPGTRASERHNRSNEYLRQKLSARNDAVLDALEAVAKEQGRTSAQVALNWVLHRPGITAPIVGARSREQLEGHLGALGWRLDAALAARLDEVSQPTSF